MSVDSISQMRLEMQRALLHTYSQYRQLPEDHRLKQETAAAKTSAALEVFHGEYGLGFSNSEISSLFSRNLSQSIAMATIVTDNEGMRYGFLGNYETRSQFCQDPSILPITFWGLFIGRVTIYVAGGQNNQNCNELIEGINFYVQNFLLRNQIQVTFIDHSFRNPQDIWDNILVNCLSGEITKAPPNLPTDYERYIKRLFHFNAQHPTCANND